MEIEKLQYYRKFCAVNEAAETISAGFQTEKNHPVAA
jgi:hypothetical protein